MWKKPQDRNASHLKPPVKTLAEKLNEEDYKKSLKKFFWIWKVIILIVIKLLRGIKQSHVGDRTFFKKVFELTLYILRLE